MDGQVLQETRFLLRSNSLPASGEFDWIRWWHTIQFDIWFHDILSQLSCIHNSPSSTLFRTNGNATAVILIAVIQSSMTLIEFWYSDCNDPIVTLTIRWFDQDQSRTTICITDVSTANSWSNEESHRLWHLDQSGAPSFFVPNIVLFWTGKPFTLSWTRAALLLLRWFDHVSLPLATGPPVGSPDFQYFLRRVVCSSNRLPSV